MGLPFVYQRCARSDAPYLGISRRVEATEHPSPGQRPPAPQRVGRGRRHGKDNAPDLPRRVLPLVYLLFADGAHGVTRPTLGGVWSNAPLLDLFMIFGVGDFPDGGGELQRPGGVLDLAPELAGLREQLRRGQFSEIAAGQFGFHLLQLGAEGVDTGGDGSEPFFAQDLEFNRLEVLDLELVLATPSDEGGLGDVEFRHEAGKGPALRAEFDKTLDGLVVVHTVLFGWDRRQWRPVHLV